MGLPKVQQYLSSTHSSQFTPVQPNYFLSLKNSSYGIKPIAGSSLTISSTLFGLSLIINYVLN